jgi:hypothetical protein
MKECQIEHHDVQVAAGAINAFLDAFGAYRSRGVKVLARHFGVDTLSSEPGSLYPVEKLLDGMRELQSQFGRSFITRIGQAIYERTAFPPNLDSVPAALAAADTAYYMNHTNGAGKLGHYTWALEGPRAGRMICDNPYPCSFDQGIFAGIAAQFGQVAKITHVDEATCRHTGGDQCTYLIEW